MQLEVRHGVFEGHRIHPNDLYVEHKLPWQNRNGVEEEQEGPLPLLLLPGLSRVL